MAASSACHASSGLRKSLLPFADRQFLAGLFQLPPRLTRFEPPSDKTPDASNYTTTERLVQLLLGFIVPWKQLEPHFVNRLS